MMSNLTWPEVAFAIAFMLYLAVCFRGWPNFGGKR